MRILRRSMALLGAVALAAQPASAQSFAGGSLPAQAAFGGAVAVAGDQVLVGEPDNMLRPGTVYVYEQQGGTWSEVASFTAQGGEQGDAFGSSIAADGTRALVGSNAGVHVFERSGDTWSQVGTLTSDAVTPEDGFGASVALSGDLALVGAPGRGEGAGAVHVFRRAGTDWVEAQPLALADVQNANFGASLALMDGRAVVGAPGVAARTGAAHVYRIDPATGASEHVAELTARGGQESDLFGLSVGVAEDMIAVGAPAVPNQGTGGVYVFRMDDGEWEADTQLLPFAGRPQMAFGATMAVADGGVWVGAPNAGVAFRFDMENGEFVGVERIAPEDADGFAATMAASGDVVAVGMPGADFGAGQAAIFESAGADDWTLAARVMSDMETFEPITGGQVDCQSGAAAGWDCSEVDLVAFLPADAMGGPRGVRMNDVWGWTDPETGKEYALAGMMNQTSFVDISDPANPVYVGRLPMTEGARANAWRDIKVYDNHAFVVADGAGQHGMQVFDLTRLRDFDGTPETYDADALYTDVASVHNIVINEETGTAFAVGAGGGGETCGGGLHMIDIRDPLAPTFIGCFADPQTGRASTGYSHDAQCVIYAGPDEQYQGREICLGSNETALSIADVTDRDNTVALSRAQYPNYGYSHQGWLTDDHRFFYMNDELDELQGKVSRTRTLIWDVTDLEDPQLVGEHLGETESSDHNLYIVGDLMYQSNYQSGLRILDISDRANPREVAYFDTVPYGTNTPGFGGSWSNYPYFDSGVVIVTSGNEGLFILRPKDQRTIS